MHENPTKQSEDLLNEASTALQRARNLVSSYDYSGTVEAAQHNIEHAVKSMYRLVDLEHPKPRSHDASVELEKVTRRLDFPEPYSYLRESLGRIRLISAMWSWLIARRYMVVWIFPRAKYSKRRMPRLQSNTLLRSGQFVTTSSTS